MIFDKPLPLSQHFCAPKHYTGAFGWLCGYSADPWFLDHALAHFTGQDSAARTQDGRIALAAMLDSRMPQTALQSVTGLAHLPLANMAEKPFRLLHAKVALLGFQHERDPRKWQLRLLVSTGNWTRQAQEASLDLLWRIDIDSASLDAASDETREDCADIKAAWNMLDWLQGFFDTRRLQTSDHGLLPDALQVMEWIELCAKKSRGKPRFFDNRKKSLLAQLPQKIRDCSTDVRRNYLAMGSGFYESSSAPKNNPLIPLQIIETLEQHGLLTQIPDRDLYVHPTACQAIAASAQMLSDEHFITIRPAMAPGRGAERHSAKRLHAKFLFSANRIAANNNCVSAWIYLGSGNLTRSGFEQAVHAIHGNLEAGVVFAPFLRWRERGDRPLPSHQVVTHLLPIQWNQRIKDFTLLSAGQEMEEYEAIHIIAPAASLGETSEEQQEIAAAAMDEQVHPSTAALAPMDIDEAWSELANFLQPEHKDTRDSEDEAESLGQKQPRKKGDPRVQAVPLRYPTRQMMELIECIAAKQTMLDSSDWTAWCGRLEQTLSQVGESAAVRYFRDQLRLNPLSPLRQAAFRPTFAEDRSTPFGQRYEDSLDHIEQCWNVATLHGLGSQA